MEDFVEIRLWGEERLICGFGAPEIRPGALDADKFATIG